ncbi:MAG: hypothetical protein V3U87_05980, partial [Methylococcaceae bacterium]
YQSSLLQQQGAVCNQLLSVDYERPTLIFRTVTNNFVVLLAHKRDSLRSPCAAICYAGIVKAPTGKALPLI